MLALTLVLMTLTTAALAADDPGLYYIGDDATPENLRVTHAFTTQWMPRRAGATVSWHT